MSTQQPGAAELRALADKIAMDWEIVTINTQGETISRWYLSSQIRDAAARIEAQQAVIDAARNYVLADDEGASDAFVMLVDALRALVTPPPDGATDDR